MTRHIDPALRAQIDAKIAAGQVTHVPAAPATKEDRIAERRERVRAMDARGCTLTEIAREIGVSIPTVANDRKALGLPPLRVRSDGDKATIRRQATSARKVAESQDRRRFKVAIPSTGRATKVASAQAQTEGRTMFPDRVFRAEGPSIEPVLKDGSMNAKIGGDVLVGRLKGAYICTLTLEERATCPRSCHHWATCYGNAMPWPRRWAPGPELEDSLRVEISEACEANALVLVRLHVLGDFYSWQYVRLWAELLDQHQGLHVFGFTAWAPGTQIGDGIARLRGAYPERFMIRHSGRTGRWGSFTLPMRPDPDIPGGWPKRIGDAVVCPEQRDPYLAEPRGTHCGNCAICWSSDRPVVFIEH
ncbi:hypothetical protein [Citreimonas sp.]|uniref:hypothetical protein n=1 Tax=Citreimonas sp. TaxID=3036715 RepID=UPI00405922BD